MLLVKTSAQVEFLLYSLKYTTRGIGLYVKSDKTKFMWLNQDGAISSLNGKPFKSVNQFIHIGSNILSTETDVNLSICKALAAIDKLMTKW